MTKKFKSLLTDKGKALIADAIAGGKTINLKYLAVGDGNGSEITPSAAQTALVNEVARLELNSVKETDANRQIVTAEAIIPADRGGFWIREAGIFTSDGILIAVSQMPVTYKPDSDDGTASTQTIRMLLAVSEASVINLTVDDSMIIATEDFVNEAIKTHEKSRNHPDATTTAKGFVQLSSATGLNDETKAATPKAVKVAYDNAEKRLEKGQNLADLTDKSKAITNLGLDSRYLPAFPVTSLATGVHYSKVATIQMTSANSANVTLLLSGANNFGNNINQTDIVSLSCRGSTPAIRHLILSDAGAEADRATWGYVLSANKNTADFYLIRPSYSGGFHLSTLSALPNATLHTDMPTTTLKPDGLVVATPVFAWSGAHKPAASDVDAVSASKGGEFKAEIQATKGIQVAKDWSEKTGGIFPGNGDSANFDTCNLDIKSWYGIGFYNTCTGAGVQGRSVYMNVRTGDFSTKGAISAGGTVSAKGNISSESNITGKKIAASTISADASITAGSVVSAHNAKDFLPTSQGAYLGWNHTSGSGATDFINHRGGGAGGFGFWNGNETTQTKLAGIDASGSLSLSGNMSSTNEVNTLKQYTGTINDGDYLNGGLLRSFLQGRGGNGDTRGAYAALYVQEHVGAENQAILNLNGFSQDHSWAFKNDGSFNSPGIIVEAGQRVYSPNNPPPLNIAGAITGIRLAGMVDVNKNNSDEYGTGCVMTGWYDTGSSHYHQILRVLQYQINYGDWVTAPYA